jgi:cell division protein FtsQ
MALRSESTRFTRRQWARRLRSARPWLLAVGGVGLVALAGWVVFFSSWLATEQVDVGGTHIVSSDEVRKVAEIDLGTPLVRVDLDAARDRIEALAAVDSATVHRSWPHTIEITVKERVPLATVLRGGQWLAMDDEGVLFRPTPIRDTGLPIVALSPSADGSARHEVASVVAALPDNLMTQTRRVRARSMDSITLNLADGRSVRWGSADESQRKVEVLAILLKRKASVYDVSVPEQPTTRN